MQLCLFFFRMSKMSKRSKKVKRIKMDPVSQAIISAAAPVVTSELMKDSAASSSSKKDKWIKWAAIAVVFYVGWTYMKKSKRV